MFANSRRLAERMTARLNELAAEQTELTPADAFPAEAVGRPGMSTGAAAGDRQGAPRFDVAGAAHRTSRRTLKSGRLPCVVATSSLELGIDMGAVDLVVQVEAPPTVASGLQRVGRAGHQVGAVSYGVVFPKFRGDLVSCAVVAERMASGAIESVRYPRNPLDVLAQHIVAMVALEPWTVTGPGGAGAAGRAVRRRCRTPRCTRCWTCWPGRYPERGVRRAAAADHLGPRRAAS